MGYTHYWRGTANADVELVEKLQHMIESTDIPLGDWSGDVGTKPTVSHSEISFNGLDEDSYESFRIKFGQESGFDFCKTARRPYDKLVVAALVLIERANPDTFSWSSDGNAEDHAEGIALAAAIAAA